ncbi:MAG: M3 family oligoendopeptidase [Clostridiales bacterium]|jgi:pepF/M3 family oligoendopeptidase|nr:M3 family oligoendopeptidase [Clostridiales bacterium]
MEMRWSLDELYTGFDSPEFKGDFEALKKEIKDLRDWAEEHLTVDGSPEDKLEYFINAGNKLEKYSMVLEYVYLILSVDTMNETAAKLRGQINEALTELAMPDAQFKKFVGSLPDLDKVINSQGREAAQHKFYLEEARRLSRYMLSEEGEAVVSKMEQTGSVMWSQLHEQLTSTLNVKIVIDGEEKSLPLPVVRNFAYDKDAELRKKAYNAELKAYEQVDKAVALALSGIKGEVITLSKLRGYESPLEMTLQNSRMDREILDAMFEAMRESFPAFRGYLRKKAEMLGHKGGLPFYDLFAPVGEVNMTFTYSEAAEFVIKNFGSFHKKLGEFAERAFNNNWIDAEPREGKLGGAFCANIHAIGQSRIMSNFAGAFNDVCTLAHELGHAFHGDCLNNETALNSNYPMPIAETASTFCETLICNAALKIATPQEALVILENDISGVTQTIVDIYSRFQFEDEVFRRRERGPFSVNELKAIMLKAQLEAYGDGLDPEVPHPYMWLCKSHYYQASHNYYNFPYAYGQLFAMGLYAQYLEEGEAFFDKYVALLAATGKASLYDIGRQAGIDVRSKTFWKTSLKVVEENIEKFIAM